MKWITLLVLLALPASAWSQSQGDPDVQRRFVAEATEEDTGLDQRPTDARQPSKDSTVHIMISEHGLEVLNPLAGDELGIGEKVVSEAIEQEGRIGDGHRDRKQYGGIRLFGWTF
ncbi:MAG: hypothetical protein AAFY98_06345 [Verrucomicrobiota bacterium]